LKIIKVKKGIKMKIIKGKIAYILVLMIVDSKKEIVSEKD